MPGLIQKVSAFLRSPQGRKYTEQAKRLAQDPKNRAKAQEMMRKFGGGKGGGRGRPRRCRQNRGEGCARRSFGLARDATSA